MPLFSHLSPLTLYLLIQPLYNIIAQSVREAVLVSHRAFNSTLFAFSANLSSADDRLRVDSLQ